MSFRQTEPPVIAAAKAGFSAATAYRIEQDPRLPSQKKAPRDRRRRDPLGRGLGQRGGAAAEEHPGPAADRHFRRDPSASSRDRRRHPAHPGAAHPHLAGAQRRRAGRHLPAGASAGPARAVRFHRHGRSRRQHRRRAARSSALSLPAGLLGLGTRPCRARRRELRGAGRGIAECAVGARPRAAAAPQRQPVGRLPQSRSTTRRQDQTRRYEALCAHYGMEPTRNNRGVAHENGSIESPHGHLKQAVEDALLLRGSRDFDTLDAYRRFVDEIVGRRNARNAKRLDLERPALKAAAGAPDDRLRGDDRHRHLDQRLQPQEGVLFGAVAADRPPPARASL